MIYIFKWFILYEFKCVYSVVRGKYFLLLVLFRIDMWSFLVVEGN